MSDYISREHKEYKIIWLYSQKHHYDDKNITLVKAKTMKALWYLLTSKFIVTTHNELVSITAANQLNISLWHGMPLKKICYLASKEVDYMESHSAKRIATSEITKSIISASFHERADNIIITGQPRNDFLFEKKKFPFLSSQHEFDKIVLYAPTFRYNQHSEFYSDGDKIENDNIFRFKESNFLELNNFLEENNILLIVKLHPFEEETLNKINLSKNVKVIKSEEFNTLGYDINHLLAISDCLLTDYSSIYFDYLILNKPIGFVIPDYESYKNNRGGFTLEPAEFWMSGEKITNQKQLMKFIFDTLVKNIDGHKEIRMYVNEALNSFKDNRNSERVFDAFIKEK